VPLPGHRVPGQLVVTRFQCCCGRCKGCAPLPIGPSSELTHAGRPYELTLLVSTVLVTSFSSKIHSQAQHLPSCKVFEYEVFKSLSTTSKTSPGPDDTPNWLFKHFAVELTPVITHILNLTLVLGKPPTLWKRAVITPVPKVPHPKELSDFRPISVTPLLSRITERILYISSYYQNLPTNSLVDQFAYRPTCSTTSCLVALEHLVAKYLETVS